MNVIWMAPFYSGGGYCSEAHAFISSIYYNITLSKSSTAANLDSFQRSSFTNINLFLSQHGDSYDQDFVKALTVNETKLLKQLDVSLNYYEYKKRLYDTTSIAICHSEPGAWSVPKAHYETIPCPPAEDVDIKIGRTMFETDKLPTGWVSRLNYMDEIWVPTEFSKNIFIHDGVLTDKIRIVPEPIDTEFYTPKYFDSDTLNGNKGLSSSVNKQTNNNKHSINKFLIHLGFQNIINIKKINKSAFFFLFVGKWETRKGLKFLLNAFYKEFHNHNNNNDLNCQINNINNNCNTTNAERDVHLVILTRQYHSSNNFNEEIYKYLLLENLISLPSSSIVTPPVSSGQTQTYPSFHVLENIPQEVMPHLYSAVDVLVIPSMGEGWGRPHVEAMACGTPIIATNWSGPTAYLNEQNGFPLKFDGLVSAEGWPGHKWALPNEMHLRELMRHVYSFPDIVETKGKQARLDMVNYYSFPVIGQFTVNELLRVKDKYTNNAIKKKISRQTNNKKRNQGIHHHDTYYYNDNDDEL